MSDINQEIFENMLNDLSDLIVKYNAYPLLFSMALNMTAINLAVLIDSKLESVVYQNIHSNGDSENEKD